MKEPEKSLYIRVIELALKYPKGFKSADILDNNKLNLEDWERSIVMRHFKNACDHSNWNDSTKGETIFLFIHGNHSQANSPDNMYMLTFDAEFTFIDFLELKFARENAREARTLSNRAIWISIIAIIVSALVPIVTASLMTQTVKIDDNQFRSSFTSAMPALSSSTSVMTK
ncbi:MAG: hypothetical protein A3C79_00300 [Candidatus Taylorbacteria bacterium RIFCSPHIGHO2_02_FULL_45_28]|uniref:Uncharacterized protein n=1 Tax=Candidatus Taylorbacteria bacterium RIFCSPHIGHO2_12_FULL_45_16 TaxID=1802315 RepID=A0A1G2MZ66_9BACT|nr:MAG: hypothetical protein A2830_01555 [Candidatus Taylorbacteria bacterium RIFCSPHIGHO2_01_FULL_44_110]OHA25467.1 MAG: hypothetical protein A3C79_00300 [Candidatus Taylorbacteria bacterium RIFCSPHIGHO2_02_FULL_45_28]OHA29134.1 MAG: hypothetical protein A3F51_00765 [Candidatus Taylorbacteria bacterium RIFCSPHIGHO2_12_FULL_45_16]OHA33356.1 MAG: hypothetical protein A3A23_01645 [Candidatus Taylorbacteria bacterium RIFCSPLOWO2_01_FULL_45_59]OHA38732.1 MAG: hypothetical protein A3I98_03460 [Candi